MTADLHTVLASIGAVALLLTLPGTCELLLVTAGNARRSRPFRPRPGNGALRLAVVIPAHDEAAVIERCVSSVAASVAQAGVDCTIAVVADNCTDRTGELAERAGARVLVRRDEDQRGKGYALRAAFDRLAADGLDAFLVIDADSIVSPTVVGDVHTRLASGVRAVQCRYQVLQPSGSIRARLMDVALLAFNVVRPRGRHAWGLSAGILGNGFALRREVLSNVAWDAASIVEDLEYHLRLVAAGERVHFIDTATVYGEIPAHDSAARVQRSRWEGGRLRMAREWSPRLAAALGARPSVLEPLVDLLTLPLAYHLALLAVAVVLPFTPSRLVAAASLAVVAAHVLTACAVGERPWRAVSALVWVPAYVLWKATTLPGVLAASHAGAGWVRTGRNEEALRPVKVLQAHEQALEDRQHEHS